MHHDSAAIVTIVQMVMEKLCYQKVAPDLTLGSAWAGTTGASKGHFRISRS